MQHKPPATRTRPFTLLVLAVALLTLLPHVMHPGAQPGDADAHGARPSTRTEEERGGPDGAPWPEKPVIRCLKPEADDQTKDPPKPHTAAFEADGMKCQRRLPLPWAPRNPAA